MGVSPAGAVVTVPTHRHVVELDFVRYEWVTAYQFSTDWAAWLRMPYDVKDRKASIELVDPATPLEIAAMQRNLEIHHPSKRLEGFSDFSLLFARSAPDVWRAGDRFTAAIGTSLPVGRTEDDPYELGDAGRAHEHIQFGTGTFNPLLELYYVTPLSKRFELSANLLGKFPLYENDKGYQGSLEASASASLALALTERFSLRAGWSSYYQGYSHWKGERDVNSGLLSHGVVGGASYTISEALKLSLGARLPVSQRTLASSGDAFEQGNIVQFGVSYSF